MTTQEDILATGKATVISGHITNRDGNTAQTTELDGAVAKSSVNGLIGTGFASRYRLQPRTGLLRKEGNVLFNDALNTFYLRLYGVTHMVKDHLDSERGNPLPQHRLLFPISSKGSFICIIPQTG